MKIPQFASRGSVAINMTPLIDVVFQLLIFFLVSSRLAQQETRMELPLPVAEGGAESNPDDPRPRVTLNVLANGQWWFVGRPVAVAELSERLRAVVAEHGTEVELRVRADRDVPYRHIEPMLAACARAGLSNVTFAVYGPGNVPASGAVP
ncbi:MAG: ExbD/TolR family protein [Planctomycetota bacterium]